MAVHAAPNDNATEHATVGEPGAHGQTVVTFDATSGAKGASASSATDMLWRLVPVLLELGAWARTS